MTVAVTRISRSALFAIALAIAVGLAGAGTAGGATNEITPCGKRHGWEISGGNFPPEFPSTTCEFATATYAGAKNRGFKNLPRRFNLTVSGIPLSCSSKSSSSYSEVRCRDSQHFVLLYKFG